MASLGTRHRRFSLHFNALEAPASTTAFPATLLKPLKLFLDLDRSRRKNGRNRLPQAALRLEPCPLARSSLSCSHRCPGAMDPRLLRLVRGYHDAIAEAVDVLGKAGIPWPVFEGAWPHCCNVGDGKLPGGGEYWRHGVSGCAVELHGRVLDFNLGPKGQVYGFDPHNLWEFAAQEPGSFGFSDEQDMLRSFDDALETREVYGCNLSNAEQLIQSAIDLWKEGDPEGAIARYREVTGLGMLEAIRELRFRESSGGQRPR